MTHYRILCKYNQNINMLFRVNQADIKEKRSDRYDQTSLVEIVAPLLTPNLQPYSNQIFPK